jgi:hypothetical protein
MEVSDRGLFLAATMKVLISKSHISMLALVLLPTTNIIVGTVTLG